MSIKNLPIEEIIKEYESGISLNALGVKYNVSQQVIRIRLVRKGIKIAKARRRNQTGINNSSYKNGLGRSTVERLTRSILKEAGVDLCKCQRCGYVSKDYTSTAFPRLKELNRHHKDQDRSNNTLENLEVLCVPCHNSGDVNAVHQRLRDSQTGKWI